MLKLPLVEPKFIKTPSVEGREVFHSYTRGLCPECKKTVDGVLETINLSGGEPTLHPDFLEFLDMARARKEISRVSISANGLRVATDYAFCEELAKRKVYVSLQLDALSNPALRVLRGGGDQRAAKEKALSNLERAGVRTTIVSTVAKG